MHGLDNQVREQLGLPPKTLYLTARQAAAMKDHPSFDQARWDAMLADKQVVVLS